MKTQICSHWIFLGAGLCLPMPELLAASVSVHPTADTTLQQSFPTDNFGDGTTFTAGERRHGGVTRAVMQFDVAGNVPAGATIDSVSLTLNVVKTPSGGPGSVFDLHRVLDSWGEGTGGDHGGSPATANQATWSLRFSPGLSWTTAGGDFAAAASGSKSIAGNGAYTFSSTANLVGDVQGWLNNPANNAGWILMSESESAAASIRRFGSRDSGGTAPTLTIQFTPIPEPNTWALLGMGSLWIGWRLRRLN